MWCWPCIVFKVSLGPQKTTVNVVLVENEDFLKFYLILVLVHEIEISCNQGNVPGCRLTLEDTFLKSLAFTLVISQVVGISTSAVARVDIKFSLV